MYGVLFERLLKRFGLKKWGVTVQLYWRCNYCCHSCHEKSTEFMSKHKIAQCLFLIVWTVKESLCVLTGDKCGGGSSNWGMGCRFRLTARDGFGNLMPSFVFLLAALYVCCIFSDCFCDFAYSNVNLEEWTNLILVTWCQRSNTIWSVEPIEIKTWDCC